MSAFGQTHQANQTLTRLQFCPFGTCHRQRGIGIERMLACLAQLAPVAHLRHAARQVCARFGRVHRLLLVLRRLVGGHGNDPGLAGIRGQPQHVQNQFAPRLFKQALLDLDPHRHRQQPRQIEMQAALPFHFTPPGQPPNGKSRIGQTLGRYQIGLGNPQGVECGLQARIVEQCNLHRSIRRQRLRQQGIDSRLGLRAGGFVT